MENQPHTTNYFSTSVVHGGLIYRGSYAPDDQIAPDDGDGNKPAGPPPGKQLKRLI